MRYLQPQPYPASERHAMTLCGDLEWQELPPAATADGAFRRGPRLGRAWANTMPAGLDTLPQAEFYCEPLLGLSIREVNEPEVFTHFFG